MRTPRGIRDGALLLFLYNTGAQVDEALLVRWTDLCLNASELNQVLADYYPNSPFLALTNVAGLGGTNVTFGVSNSVAGSFSVQYSTDLVNWFYLGPANPRYLFSDTNAPAVPQRYYRLTYP